MDGISIVIISRGRQKLLEELFESVQTAREKADFPTEIILVDSSLGDDREAVRRLGERYQVNYFYQDITVSAKRNYGVAQSSYEVVLFLDSDCLATLDILKNYAEIYRNHPDAAGAGGPLEFVGEDTWFWKVVEKTPYTIFFSAAKWGETMKWSPTANFSVKKEAFLSIGGFDETFPKDPGGEDVDLGLRLSRLGTIYSVPDALVYHSKATWSPVKAMFRRVFHYGAGELYLMERYPQMVCSGMPRRICMIVCGMILYLILGLLLNPWFFLGIVLTPAAECTVTSVGINRFASYKGTAFGKQFAVQLLLLWNEMGFLRECVRRRKIRYMEKQLIHFRPQMDGVCQQNVMTAWIYSGYLLVTFLLVIMSLFF
ncbi:MAG: glycosyltransferase [Clostridiales bacterium]|nr:glycosyltransferase [Clostridiales bacterium]